MKTKPAWPCRHQQGPAQAHVHARHPELSPKGNGHCCPRLDGSPTKNPHSRGFCVPSWTVLDHHLVEAGGMLFHHKTPVFLIFAVPCQIAVPQTIPHNRLAGYRQTVADHRAVLEANGVAGGGMLRYLSTETALPKNTIKTDTLEHQSLLLLCRSSGILSRRFHRQNNSWQAKPRCGGLQELAPVWPHVE